MNKHNAIWFVIVTYQPERTALRQLMTSLEGQKTIVIDNTTNNIGYGARANEGMRNAFAAGANWAVVCNQDITVTKDGIAQYVKILNDSAPGVVGPEAGTLDPKRWTTVLASRHIRQAQCEPGLERGDETNLYISGSMMAIHQAVWEKIGGFYEPYFLYYEDADLSVRAKKAGFLLRQVGIEGFRHGSMEKRTYRLDPRIRGDDKKGSSDDGRKKEYYLARNHLLFVRRLAPVSVKVHEFLRLPKTIAEHHAAGNTDAIRGISDFAVGRFGKQL